MIYLVMKGEADEHEPPTIKRASSDKEKCEAYIAEQEAFDKKVVGYIELGDKFEEEFKATKPRPEWRETEQVPRWESGLGKNKITDAMRAEREAIIARNNAITLEDRAVLEVWENELDAFVRKSLLEQGVEEQYLDVAIQGWTFHWQNKYWIREVKEL